MQATTGYQILLVVSALVSTLINVLILINGNIFQSNHRAAESFLNPHLVGQHHVAFGIMFLGFICFGSFFIPFDQCIKFN